MQPTLLASRDPQILQELTQAFPESPEFVQYLRSSIVSLGGTDVEATLNGTRAVAKLFVRGLKLIQDAKTPVDAKIVAQLSVHEDPLAITKIDRVLFERNPDYFENCVVFGQWLHAEIDGDTQTSRKGIVSEYKKDYMRLFICAYAMMTGLELDVRNSGA